LGHSLDIKSIYLSIHPSIHLSKDPCTMASKSSYFSPASIFLSKKSYEFVASEFHPYHKHDLNVFLHLLTTGLGIWGAIQMAVILDYEVAIYAYAAIIALTTPFLTATLHSAFVVGCLMISIESIPLDVDPLKLCALAIAAGYGLQDLAHYLCGEKTMMSAYITSNPSMLLVHTLWLMPLVIDAAKMRSFFLPNLVSRNRNIVVKVASTKAVEDLREWINTNIPETPQTTHVWPHKQDKTDKAATALENDAGIMAGFREVFAAKHYDVISVVEMNEIYVTAVGAKQEINSDAVFYTPHTDGPYWWLPGASLYRVLVGVTPNQMVRTRFNLQHESFDQVLNTYMALGFDYNRELHWIDHVPGAVNKERRSLLKLHFIVYPKGWHRYGKFCATLNATYNTWARNNFLRTLRPKGILGKANAWWIWVTTWVNALVVNNIGWANLSYIGAAYAMGSNPFLILTSFRHYAVYMTTFAYRSPSVAHGNLMRDAKLYKALALMHLAKRLVPLIDLPNDIPGILLACTGFGITILATARLGFLRTYFGSELGFCKPEWIHGFPYGTIPHPMIVGQLLAYSSILFWWRERLSMDNVALIGAHMTCYVVHMVQEMLTSSY
jgi:hypothetical protein